MTGSVPVGYPSAGLPVRDDGECPASGEPVLFDGSSGWEARSGCGGGTKLIR